MTAQTTSHKKRTARKKGPVARVTAAAENIHRSIAGFPLNLLEQVEPLSKPVGRIRKLQDKSITATYDVVRGVQDEVKRLAREGGADRRKRRASRKPARASQRGKSRRGKSTHAASEQPAPRPVRPATAAG
jgi:hypothetical protein